MTTDPVPDEIQLLTVAGLLARLRQVPAHACIYVKVDPATVTVQAEWLSFVDNPSGSGMSGVMNAVPVIHASTAVDGDYFGGYGDSADPR